MGVTNSNKVINTDRIACDGSLRVSLTLSAAPDIITNPTDIVLILDRSGSMAGIPLTNMKLGAKTFIDIIDEATDNTQDGQIGSGSRIGIVSFSNTAVANTQLITSVDTLKSAVDSLTASGTTNHADAFTKAIQLFDPASSNAKVIVNRRNDFSTLPKPTHPRKKLVTDFHLSTHAEVRIVHFGILHIFCTKTVNNSIQELVYKTNLYQLFFAAIHRKHSLGIGFQVSLLKRFFARSRLA